VPPDFAFESYENGDITEDILNETKPLFLFITYDVSKSDKEASKQFSSIASAIEKDGFKIYGATSSDLSGETEDYRHDNQLAFEFLQGDEKVLKTIVRSNPGLLMLKDGKVINKWAAHDIPSYEELKSSGIYP